MSTTSSSEIQQLQEFIKENFNNLDRKIDKVQIELKEDINQVKSELKEDINQVKSELKEDINQVKSELKEDINQVKFELKEDINQVKFELKEDIHNVEKQVIKIESDLEAMDKRLSNVETAIQKIPEITEKFGELKNWRQTAFIIIAAVAGWFARSNKF